MRKSTIKIIAISLFVLSFAFVTSAQTSNCNWEEYKKDIKKELKPYRYYAFKVTTFSYGPTKKLKEVEVPLFADGDYRFVFSVDGVSMPIEVEIYDKPAKNPSRKKIYENTTNKGDFIFETSNTGNLNRIYINYIIPATTDGSESVTGCMLFYSGTKGNF
jgi:hypothetical protein